MFELYLFYCALVIILISIIDILIYQIYTQKKMIDLLIDKLFDLDYEQDFRKMICHNIPQTKCDTYGDDKCIYDYIKSEVEKDVP